MQSLVAGPRLFELVDLDLKYGQNGRGRVAWLELGGERMSGEILFSLFFICLEGFFKDDIETGRGCFRCGSLGGRARTRSRRLTHAEGIVVAWRMRSMTRLESRKALVSMGTVSEFTSRKSRKALLDSENRRSKCQRRPHRQVHEH